MTYVRTESARLFSSLFVGRAADLRRTFCWRLDIRAKFSKPWTNNRWSEPTQFQKISLFQMLFNYLEISRVRQFNDLDRFEFNGSFSFAIPRGSISAKNWVIHRNVPAVSSSFEIKHQRTHVRFRRSQSFVSAFCELIVTKISVSVAVWELKRPAR